MRLGNVFAISSSASLQAAWFVRQNHVEAKWPEYGVRRPHLTIRDLSGLCRALGGPVDLSSGQFRFI